MTNEAVQTVAQERSVGGKYLTFKLGREEFGLEILKVQEIIKMMDVTKVPRTPEYVCGIINLRGQVIPVIDLRTKFEMPLSEHTDLTCIIVVQVQHPASDGQITMGVVVDEVSEVMDIAADDVEPPSFMGTGVATEYILGIAKARGKIKILLDIDRVLSNEELAGLQQAV